MTTKQRGGGKIPTPTEPNKNGVPAVVVFGKPGCGKTTLADLFMKFFETSALVDGADLGNKDCPFDGLVGGTLYLTTHEFDARDVLHGQLGHGIAVMSFYDALRHMGEAEGRTMCELAQAKVLEMTMEQILRGASKATKN